MKLSILRDTILPVLQIIVLAVRDNPVIQACSHFLIDASLDGKIRIAATDIESEFRQTVTGKVEQEGAVLVPAGYFLEMIKTQEGDVVHLSTSDKYLRVEGGISKGKLKTLDVDEYPQRPTVDGRAVSIKSSLLQTLIAQTSFAADKSDYGILSGVLATIDQHGISFAASERVRLAVKDCEAPELVSEKITGVIPARSLEMLLKILPDEGDVDVTLGSNVAQFQIGELTFTSSLLQGDYPEYERIIPDTTATMVRFDKKDLLGALGVAGVFGTRDHQVDVTFSDNEAVFFARNGEGDMKMAIDAYVEGDGLPVKEKLRLNSRQIRQCVNVLSGETPVVLGLNGFKKPVTLRSKGDERYVYVVTPLSLK